MRREVASFYGSNGHVSVDPVIIIKLMLLLFLDDVRSEHELTRIVPPGFEHKSWAGSQTRALAAEGLGGR